jgi:hypothetical protein
MSREWDSYINAGTVAELVAALQALTAADPAAAAYRISLAGCDCYGPWEHGATEVDHADRIVVLERRNERDVSKDNEATGRAAR